MDEEMQGVIARIHELIVDLSAEYTEHLDDPEVTQRAKNVFHEVLVKMRSALDMTMYRIWEKYTAATLTETQKAKAPRVYFPICDTREKFDGCMRKCCPQLQSANPALYALLLQSQPFSTKQSAMSRLRDLSNLGKHVRLSQQRRRSRPATRMQRTDGSVLIVAPALSKNEVLDRDGDAVVPESIETINWVDFSVDGTENADPVIFCGTLSTGLVAYLTKILAYV